MSYSTPCGGVDVTLGVAGEPSADRMDPEQFLVGGEWSCGVVTY